MNEVTEDELREFIVAIIRTNGSLPQSLLKRYHITLKEIPQQPPIGGFCDTCGHFAGRHDKNGCHFDRPDPEPDCDCKVMVWQEVEWPRPWHPAPRGLVATDDS